MSTPIFHKQRKLTNKAAKHADCGDGTHVCNTDCFHSSIKWNPEKAEAYATHILANTDLKSAYQQAIDDNEIERANGVLHHLIYTAAQKVGMGKKSSCLFYKHGKRIRAGMRKAHGLMMYANLRKLHFLQLLDKVEIMLISKGILEGIAEEQSAPTVRSRMHFLLTGYRTKTRPYTNT